MFSMISLISIRFDITVPMPVGLDGVKRYNLRECRLCLH